MRHTAFLVLLSVAALIPGCRKEDTPVSTPTPSGPRLILKFAFDSTQVRLDELGQPEPTLPAGHAAQHPRFNAMSAHYVEFAPTAWTLPGQGSVVYHAPETSAGGDVAIDFAQSVLAGQGEVFLNVPLSTLTPGAYPWIRVSLGYQNYTIDFRYTDTVFGLGAMDLTGTVASFIGFNTYIGTFAVDQQTLTVNDDRPQGFWAFEVNATSPIPGNSCLVTGGFAQPLVITGQETEDVVITVSLSTNNSFEWIDNGDGHYEPLAGDLVVDMGIRGLIPIVE